MFSLLLQKAFQRKLKWEKVLRIKNDLRGWDNAQIML